MSHILKVMSFIECVMSYREWVWFNWYTVLDDTDRVDAVSDTEGVTS